MTSNSAQTNPPAQPPAQPEIQPAEPGFGWTSYAEIINGRFAMIGFVALLILELFTRQDFFSWLGLR
jgi:hypothetical protein